MTKTELDEAIGFARAELEDYEDALAYARLRTETVEEAVKDAERRLSQLQARKEYSREGRV